ncbi:MAG: phosphatase PAP2 family protein [Pseudomonadota bacterium]
MKLAVFSLLLAFLLPAWGGLILCPAGHCVLTGLDEAGLRLAHGQAQPGLDLFMQGITWLGSVWLLLPLAGVLALALWRGGRRVEAAFLMAALLGAIALAHGIKPWIDRPRPDLFPMLIPLPADASYPSAHTLQVVAMTLALAILAERRRLWVWPLLALAALLVGWSRIHLQVHFPTDVLAGALAATLWVSGLYLLFSKQSRAEA